jgi:ketosteroid isomerase-like protein
MQNSTEDTLALIEKFNQAFNLQDSDAVMALMTEECVFENTNPPPDGTRHAGQEAVRAAFKEFFCSSPQAKFEAEAIYAASEHCTVQWVYHWIDAQAEPGHIRVIDLFRIRQNKISAKLSYVKG